MKSRLEEDLRIGDLEGLIMDKFQVDSFQPKFCDEKDVAVISFLVTKRDSAVKLSETIARGPFNFLNVEASSSPDEGGSYVVLAELDRSREMFSTIDQLLRYLDQQVHINDWYFKPYASDKHIPWNKENFEESVPQNPHDFQFGKNEGAGDGKLSAKPAAKMADVPETGIHSEKMDPDTLNYSLLARIVEKEISKSSRGYFVELQKQFRKVTKDNRRLLQHFKQIKSDHQHLVKQLDLHQRREKLALMREQQDIKRIRDLEDRLTYLLLTGPEKREIPVSDSSTPTIAIEADGTSAAGNDAEEIVEPEISSADWTTSAEQAGAGGAETDDARFEKAKILQPDERDLNPLTGGKAPGEPVQTDMEPVDEAIGTAGLGAEVKPDGEAPATTADESPVNAYFRQAMEASRQKDYPAAIEYFTLITELSPDEPRAYYNLAILYFRSADFEKAGQCASKAIELGADGAQKILKKIAVKKSGKTAGKTGSTEQGGMGENRNAPTDRPQRRGRHANSPADPGEDPLSYLESATVEIDGPPFADPAARESDPVKGLDRGSDLSVADTEEFKKEELPTVTGFGGDDTIVIDSESLAAVQQDESPDAAADASGRADSPLEAALPPEQVEPEAIEAESDLEDLPTAALDDFIQKADKEPDPIDEESVVGELPGEGQPAEETASAGLEAAVEAAAVGDGPTPAAGSASPEKQAAGPEKDLSESKESTAVTDMDLFARGLAASKKKNYAEALQHFTKFAEQNPTQPRGYYNLAILHYRLKDYETACDMARKALDMGAGAAQKIYEKSKIRLAKERSISLEPDVTATTDTIFEELDTAAFETIDPQSLEEIGETQSVEPSAPDEQIGEEAGPAAGRAVVQEHQREGSVVEPAAAVAQTGEAQSADGIPEFPVLTGELAQEAEIVDGETSQDTAAKDLPEIEAVPVPKPVAEEESSAVAADASEIKTPLAATKEKPVEAVAAAPPGSKAAAPKIDAEEKKSPVTKQSDDEGAVQPEADPDRISEDLFAEGMAAYSKKDLENALEIFNRFVSLRPREPRGYYNLAIVYYRKKDYPAAEANAEKALKLGARAANKILRKIKKKLKIAANSIPPVTAAKKRGNKRQKPVKAKTAASAQPGLQPKAAGLPKHGDAVAEPISMPEPVGGAVVEDNLGDLSDYDTATFDIAEVLGHEPVVWDADDMDGEVDTSEIQAPLTGDATNDDVIVFESTAAAEPAKAPASKSSRAAAGSSGSAAKSDSSGDNGNKKAKGKGSGDSDTEGSEVFSLGLAASEKKEYLKAIRYFKHFTQLSPQDPRGFYNLAVVSYRLKSYETAREHAKRAVELGSKPAAKILTKLKSMRVAA